MGAALGAVIPAAGRSSRMEVLKPLLPLSDGSFLRHELALLAQAGVVVTVVVTGREARRVETETAGPGVRFVHNPDFANTSMLDSLRLGLAALPEDLEGAFFLPADAPVFSLFTLLRERAAFERGDAPVIRPVYRGKSGHPLLLRRELFSFILRYDGPQGLRGALAASGAATENVPVPDPGIRLDADDRAAYEALLAYERSVAVPDRARCLDILEWADLPQKVYAHSLAVAEGALHLARALNAAGLSLDLPLTEAAALLHDVAKGNPRHGELGALWLRQLGMPRVAEIVARHMELPADAGDTPDESAVVFLADKLFLDDRPCTVEERYARRLEEYRGDAAASAAILARQQQARRLLSRWESLTGKRL